MEAVPGRTLERTQQQLVELHAYVRHTIQQLVTWFTFFAGVNYASMGWLAVTLTKEGQSSGQAAPVFPYRGPLVEAVAAVFIAQNALGILVPLFARSEVLRAFRQVLRCERTLAGEESASPDECPMPIRLYSTAPLLMAAALVPLLGAWIWFLCALR